MWSQALPDRDNSWEYEKYYFVCGTYSKVKGGCKSHYITNVAIEKILLESIRDITSYARSRESEFVELAKRIFALSITMDKEKEDSLNAELFLNIVKKYTDTNELTAGVLREFVEKVYVYHPEKVDGQKTQCIKSVWNCIGEFTTPQAK